MLPSSSLPVRELGSFMQKEFFKQPECDMNTVRRGTRARDAEISLYNVLAKENTRLFSLYVDLDPRCRTQGSMVRLFA